MHETPGLELGHLDEGQTHEMAYLGSRHACSCGESRLIRMVSGATELRRVRSRARHLRSRSSRAERLTERTVLLVMTHVA